MTNPKINLRRIKRNKVQKRSRGAPTKPHISAQKQLLTQTPLFKSHTRKRMAYYASGFDLAGTAGAIAQYAFSANGLYDPDVTGTGHQPLGFDTMMLYYEQYTVLQAQISLRFAGNGIQPITVSLCLAPDTTSLPLPDVVENGLVKLAVVDGRGNTGYGTGQRIGRLDLSCDVAKYFGRRTKRELLDDDKLYGTVAANPTEQVYFIINMWGFGALTDNTSCTFDAIIEYDAIFWEPRKVAAQLLARSEPERKTQPRPRR